MQPRLIHHSRDHRSPFLSVTNRQTFKPTQPARFKMPLQVYFVICSSSCRSQKLTLSLTYRSFEISIPSLSPAAQAVPYLQIGFAG